MGKSIKKVFVYTEVQASIPFSEVPWREINQNVLKNEGFVRKTWLSGVNSNSVGGLYEFDSLEAAQKFAWDAFPKEARNLGVSFMTKIFDGDITEEASRGLSSPHYDA